MTASKTGRRVLPAAVAAALLLGGLMLFLPQGDTRIDPANRELVALGKEVYAAECASCHGAELEGQPDWQRRNAGGRLPAPPHDESGHTWHHPDELLFRITKFGPQAISPGYESDMPAFAERLDDREIRAALAYIKSRWPAAIRERQEAQSR